MAFKPYDGEYTRQPLPDQAPSSFAPYDGEYTKTGEEGSGLTRRLVGDTAVTALKGAIGIPEAAVGLADIATGGHAGKLAEEAGFRPKEAKAMLDDLYSPEQKAANKAVSDADGFVDTLGAAVQNPSTIAHTVVESLPSMLAGGAIGKGLGAATKLPGWALGAAGEGVVGAGSAAEGTRQQTEDGLLTGEQSGLAALSGVATGVIGAGAGKLANKLGIGDADTFLAGGAVGTPAKPMPLAGRVAAGIVSEGLLEEAPQSAQEQILSNVALDRDAMQGVGSAVATGLLAGGVMGGAAAGLIKPQVQPTPTLENPNPAPVNRPDPSAGSLSAAASLLPTITPSPVADAAKTRIMGSNAENETASKYQPIEQVAAVAQQLYRTEQDEFNPGKLKYFRYDADLQSHVQVPEKEALAAAQAHIAAQPSTADGEATQGAGDSLAADHAAPVTPAPLTGFAHDDMTPYQRNQLRAAGVSDEQIGAMSTEDALKLIPEQDPLVARDGDYIPASPYAKQSPVAGGDVFENGREQPNWNYGEEGGDSPVAAQGLPAPQRQLADGRPDAGFIETNAAGESRQAKAGNVPPKDYVPQGGRGMEQQVLPGQKYSNPIQAKNAIQKAGAAATHEAVQVGPKQFEVRAKQSEAAPGATAQPVTGSSERVTGSDAVPALQPAADEVAVSVPETAPAKRIAVVKNAPAAVGQTALPEILRHPKKLTLAKMAKAAGLKKGSPGYETAIAKLEPEYERQVDDAQAALPFEQFHALNKESPEGVNRQAWKALRQERGIEDAADPVAADEQPETAKQATQAPVKDDAPAAVGLASKVEAAADTAATSKNNSLPEPTAAQKEAGNYPKGHVSVQGLALAIENPKDSERSGTRPDGSTWSHTMSDHYGYIKRTEGADGDHVDIYLGANPLSEKVFVVDQIEQETGGFDEHKVMLGFDNQLQATNAYSKNFDKGWKVGKVTALSMDGFKAWLADGDQSKPLSGQSGKPANQAAIKDKAPTADPAKVAASGEQAPVSQSRIEDVGEKLGGARKDAPKGMSKDWTTDEIIAQPLSKIWPASSIDEIEDKFQAAVAFTTRGEIPAKPRVGYKVSGWASKVEALRGMANLAIRNREAFDKALRGISTLHSYADKIALLEAIDRSQWSRIGQVRVYPDAYRMESGEKIKLPHSSVEIDGKHHRFDDASTIADAVEAVNKLLGNDAAAKLMQFEIRSGRGSGKFDINKKGDKEYRTLKSFDSLKDARGFISSNNADLVAAWGAVKESDNVKKADVRGESNRPRSGADHRQGRDVTADEFKDAFGFRGVEFGNWVGQGAAAKERQGMINAAYDALSDLAAIVGVPPKAISLNGTLGLGFGSRGKGNAAAHFEPGNLVINLTKTKGAGVLAHEWFHALDNYFSRRRGGEVPIERGLNAQSAYRQQNYITYRPEPLYVHKTKHRGLGLSKAKLEHYGRNAGNDGHYHPSNWHIDPAHPQGVRPEVERSFADLVEALDASPMKARADMNDSGPEGYWGRIIERAARSFENYVISKMMAGGYHNDYLANVRDVENFQRSKGRYPYLLPEEVAPIAEAFDSLFGVIETREDEAGNVALFSRRSAGEAVPLFGRDKGVAGAASAVLEHDAVKVIVERINARLRLGTQLLTYRSEAELFAAVPEIERQAERDGAEGQVNAVYYSGKVHVVTGAFVREADVEMAILDALAHEGQGHYGIRALFGGDARAIDAELREVFAAIGGVVGVKRLAAKHGFDMSLYLETAAGMSERQRAGYLADELLAHLQGRAATASLSARAMAAIRSYLGAVREWLRSHGFTNLAKGTDADIAWLLKRMREASTVKPEGRGDSARFSRNAKQTATAAFKRWFGDSKAVDSAGQPLPLKHGTAEDFTVFDQGRAGRSTGHATAPLGIFMTADASSAKAYAVNASEGMPGLAKVLDLHASIRNPFEMTVAQSQALDTVEKSRAFRADLERQGYDGIQLKGTPVWIAFSNTQMKSATDNNGEFDELDPDIRFSRNPTADALGKLGMGEKESHTLAERLRAIAEQDWRKTLSDLKDRTNEGLIDGLAGIYSAEKSLGIATEKMGYLSARMATGLADHMKALMNYGALEWRDGAVQQKADTRGLLDVLSDVGNEDMAAWLGWLGGKRAELLKRQGKENNLTDADIAELLSVGDKAAKFEKAYQEYAKLNNAILDLAEGAGLIDPKARAGWMTDYYVPFYRQEEGENQFTGPSSKKGLSHQTAAIKALKGGTMPTKDLLENILTAWTKRVDASIKNRALNDIVANLGGTEFMTEESMKWQRQVISRAELVKMIRGDRNYLEYWAEQLGLDETANHLQVAHELNKLSAEGYEEHWAQVAPTDPAVIRVMIDGKAKYYRVNEPSLLRGLVAMAGNSFNDPVTKIGRWFKRVLTTGITASPDFMARNFLRDAVHAWVINPDGYKLGIDSVKGLRAAFKEDPHYQELIFAGGAFQGGYIMGNDPEAAAIAIRRALAGRGLTGKQQADYMAGLLLSPAQMGSALKKGWEHYRDAGDKIENANRLATYKAALAAGKSVRLSAYEARDLMDYSMRGNFAAMVWLTDMVPFLNARLQGLGKLGRAMKGDKTLLAKHVAMKGTYIALFSLLLAGMNDDDERYKALEDWDKDANWHFWFSADQVAPYRIPKPFELGLIFGTIPERMFHLGAGSQDKENFGRAMVHGLTSTLAFNPIPQFYTPIRDVQANRDFFRDSPIEGMADEGKLSAARYDSRTSEVARLLGEYTGPTMGLSPKQLQYLWKGYTGTIGGYVLSMADKVAEQIMEGTGESLPWSAADVPVVQAFYKGENPKGTRYQTDFYDMLEEATQLSRTVKAMREEGRTTDADELRADNRDKIAANTALGRVRQQLGANHSRAETVRNDKSMSGAQKQSELNRLQLQANILSKRAVDQFGGRF